MLQNRRSSATMARRNAAVKPIVNQPEPTDIPPNCEGTNTGIPAANTVSNTPP